MAARSSSSWRPRSRACVEPGASAGQEHTGGVGWVEARHGAGDPPGDLGLDLVEDRGEQVGLVTELMVEGAAGHVCLPGDTLGAQLGYGAHPPTVRF